MYKVPVKPTCTNVKEVVIIFEFLLLALFHCLHVFDLLYKQFLNVVVECSIN